MAEESGGGGGSFSGGCGGGWRGRGSDGRDGVRHGWPSGIAIWSVRVLLRALGAPAGRGTRAQVESPGFGRRWYVERGFGGGRASLRSARLGLVPVRFLAVRSGDVEPIVRLGPPEGSRVGTAAFDDGLEVLPAIAACILDGVAAGVPVSATDVRIGDFPPFQIDSKVLAPDPCIRSARDFRVIGRVDGTTEDIRDSDDDQSGNRKVPSMMVAGYVVCPLAVCAYAPSCCRDLPTRRWTLRGAMLQFSMGGWHLGWMASGSGADRTSLRAAGHVSVYGGLTPDGADSVADLGEPLGADKVVCAYDLASYSLPRMCAIVIVRVTLAAELMLIADIVVACSPFGGVADGAVQVVDDLPEMVKTWGLAGLIPPVRLELTGVGLPCLIVPAGTTSSVGVGRGEGAGWFGGDASPRSEL